MSEKKKEVQTTKPAFHTHEPLNHKEEEELKKVYRETEATAEKKLIKQEKTMRQILDAQPKEKVMIPVDPMNPHEPQIVGVNGIFYKIPRGKEFEVPKSVAEIWRNSYMKNVKIQMRTKIRNLDKPNEAEITVIE